MKTLVVLLLYLTCYIPTLILLAINPYITRKAVCFGVCIPEDAHSNPEIIGIKKSYLNKTLLTGGLLSIASLLPAVIIQSETTYSFLPASILLMVAIMYIFYFKSYNQVKTIKSKMNWVDESSQVVIVDTSFRNKKFIASPLWFLLYALVIIITIISTYVLYDKIPDRIPTGWDFNGEVRGWMPKSYKTLLWAPMVQAFIMIIMVFSYWMIGKAKQIIDPADPGKSAHQNRRFRYMWSIYIITTGFVLTAMIGSLQLSMFGLVKNKLVISGLPLVVVFGIVTGAIILSLTTGQGGSRLFTNKDGSGSTVGNKISRRDDDKYWKLGLFYYNPDDPSIVVEKRFGIGWTNNWARPISWILTIGLLALITGFMTLSNILTK
ncbi:DUF1648 domain-containing protein [Pseudobacteroides cellulosolvens]|uniref:DUF1648 domain-containing protein n=1 Tax=Pseudobacteroides cellulosolvens ATCC 35603 = DSM 2933 TaxID=398512 RepID=A0A0L6JR66_9FIRM|nr:DUF5808 domain-containing protein [Pseudobacteroides cellulosolvens]KNY28331.1 protein of unknown function DUF1648 [Pseudobacteroides cellulosolvens ATCC 35603 = DSM 2933]